MHLHNKWVWATHANQPLAGGVLNTGNRTQLVVSVCHLKLVSNNVEMNDWTGCTGLVKVAVECEDKGKKQRVGDPCHWTHHEAVLYSLRNVLHVCIHTSRKVINSLTRSPLWSTDLVVWSILCFCMMHSMHCAHSTYTVALAITLVKVYKLVQHLMKYICKSTSLSVSCEKCILVQLRWGRKEQ